MPIISIVVPTRNRAQILSAHIESVRGIVPQGIEYLFYDNSETAITLDSSTEKDFKYIHDSRKHSVGDNFSAALSACRGEYVAFIGDDDRVDLNTLGELGGLLLKNSSTEVIIAPIFDLIFHKGSGTKWTGLMSEDTVITPNSLGRSLIRLIDWHSKVSQRCEKFWLLSPDLWSVSKGYFGMFKKSLLLESKGDDSREIYLSPDAFMMGKLSKCKNILRLQNPLFVPGTSATSTSNLSNQRRHVGTITEQKHFDSEDLKHLPKGTPNSFIPEVIWAGSFLAGKRIAVMDPNHALFIAIYIRIKHGVDINNTNQNIFNLMMRSPSIFIIAAAAYIFNRAIVSVLIVARYGLSERHPLPTKSQFFKANA